MKPSINRILLLTVFLCATVVSTFAQAKNFPAYTGHVNDFAGVMDSATKQKLETILTNFEQMTGTQIAAVIVQSLNDRPIEEYSNALYRAWGIGAKTGENKNKGALLIVALQDRKTRMEVGYGLEGDMPDGLAGEIRLNDALNEPDASSGVEPLRFPRPSSLPGYGVAGIAVW